MRCDVVGVRSGREKEDELLVVRVVSRSVCLGDFDGEGVVGAEHVRAENHELLVGRETGVGLEAVVVLRHVDEFLRLEVAALGQIGADRAFAGNGVGAKEKNPRRMVVAVAAEKFSVG